MEIRMVIWNGCENLTAVFQNADEAIEVYEKLLKALKSGKDHDEFELELVFRGNGKDA